MASIVYQRQKLLDANLAVNIGKYEGNCKDKNLNYDVSSFLSDFDSMGPEWHNKLDNFIEQLDDNVKIDINHEMHKPVVNGLDDIIGIICAELPKYNECYAGIKHYKSGSMYAGLRVGFPYEADIILETQTRINNKMQNRFKNDILRIINGIHKEKWIIYGVKDMFLGACLILEYKHNNEGKKGVGVLVDLVLCHSIEGNIETHDLNTQARSFLRCLRKPIDFHKYQLSIKDNGYDSGYVKNQLLKQLPEHVKVAYRVTKYLLQSGLVSKKVCVDNSNVEPFSKQMSEEQSCDLYGYKPLIKSYVLQVCLLNLLIQTHDTKIEDRLTKSALTLCLIDMAYVVAAAATHNTFYAIYLNDPICVQMGDCKCILVTPPNLQLFCRTETLIKTLFDIISCRVMNHSSRIASVLQYYSLCNRPSDAIVTVMADFSAALKEKSSAKKYNTFEGKLAEDIMKICNNHYSPVIGLNLTGFCRGACPESMAAAHDDKVQECGGQINLEDENILEDLYIKLRDKTT